MEACKGPKFAKSLMVNTLPKDLWPHVTGPILWFFLNTLCGREQFEINALETCSTQLSYKVSISFRAQ